MARDDRRGPQESWGVFPLFRFSPFVHLEEGLEYALRGDRVDGRLEPRASGSGGAQRLLGVVGGEPLVHELDADAEAAAQALAETPRQRAHRMLAAVLPHGQAHHQQGGAPFRYQALDRGEAGAIVRAGNMGQGVSQPGFEIADGDADAPGAEVEPENGPRSRVRGEG